MLITELLQHELLSRYHYDNGDNVIIKGITCDSRAVKKDYLFIAVKGFEVDGNNYIDAAVASGAALVVTSDQSQEKRGDIPVLIVDNDRLAYSLFSAAFYRKKPKNMVAVTGTNGKTSVVNFCKQLWNALGEDALSVGTLGMILNGKPLNPDSEHLTTPSAETLHATLEEIASKQIQNVAIEASSQGLDQHRLDGFQFNVAAFTNLSREHLDYHETMQNYLDAKMYLFEHLVADSGVAVLNADTEEFETIKTRCETKGVNILSYGEKGEDITLLNIAPQPNGQIIAFEIDQVRYKILVPLVGGFQAYNVMATLGILKALDVNLDVVVGKLTGLKSVPGRMERVGNHPKKAGIYVDYAHSPDALEKALKALRPHTRSKLYVVFGCGGDRDKGKRKVMGSVAAEYADYVIVTDDNPRTEDSGLIRAEVMQGCGEAENIGDRYAAIKYAVSLLKEGDTLLIAGKGHEDYQIIGKQKLHFDDRVKACEAITAVEETF